MDWSKLISLVPAGIAIYKVYTQKDEISKELESLKDTQNANILALRDDIDRAQNTQRSIVDDFTITPTAYFHSLVNKYWDSAFFVNIKNNSNYICYLRGIRMAFDIKGNIADFYPYWVGKMIIQPGQSIDVRLGGTNNICIFLQKAMREQVCKALQTAGKGNYTDMYCNFEFVVGTVGFNDIQKFPRKNIVGKAYYENSNWDGVYSNQGDRGNDVELFDGSN